MFSKKKFILISKINFLILVFILLINIMPVTFSKYQSIGTGNINSNIAFYLLESTYVTEQVKLNDLVPSDNPYVFNFTIGNQRDDDVSEVDIEYVLQIITTTNLPLRYELYKNCNFLDNSSVNLITDANTEISQDEYGTYFQKFSIGTEYLYYSEPLTNEYTLVVYFDKSNNDAKYQGMVEAVKISIDSKQMVN